MERKVVFYQCYPHIFKYVEISKGCLRHQLYMSVHIHMRVWICAYGSDCPSASASPKSDASQYLH